MTITISATSLPAFGAACAGGFFGGVIRIGALLHAVIWAPKAQGEAQGVWLPDSKPVPGAQSCFDSAANTLAMAEAGSALAQCVMSLEIDGIGGWAIPARDVLELAYRHLKPTTQRTVCSFRDGENPSSWPAGYPYGGAALPMQTEAIAFKAGGEEAFEPVWYWSSTQSDEDDAWSQDFYLGRQDVDRVSWQARCRAVRLIQLTA